MIFHRQQQTFVGAGSPCAPPIMVINTFMRPPARTRAPPQADNEFSQPSSVSGPKASRHVILSAAKDLSAQRSSSVSTECAERVDRRIHPCYAMRRTLLRPHMF